MYALSIPATGVSSHIQDNSIAAIECLSKKIFGICFHPELIATQRGGQILSNFIYKVCGCIGSWTVNPFIKKTVSEIKKTVGKNKVILNLTPTLGSSVTALLLNKAVGKKLKCVFIDSGLLHKDELKQMSKIFDGHWRLNLKFIDRSRRFLQGLKGISDPEEKKKAVSAQFARIFKEEVKKAKGAKFLAQETFYSKSGKPVNPANQNLKLKILEPLRSLFKDEVKSLAKELGLPDSLIFRQPFPEAGLANRIMGEVSASRLKILQEAQACLVEEIKLAGIYEQVWQSFAVLLPLKNIIAVRCIASTDGIKAEWVRLPYEIMEKISRRILTKAKGIRRVVYDISSCPPTAIEWE